MYDGYHIGNQDIYNPWSLLNYADTQKLISSWVNTSANSMIKNALKQADYALKQGRDVLIPQSALNNSSLSWPKKYIKKGAHSFKNLKDVLNCCKGISGDVIEMDEDTRIKAKKCIDKMIEMG